MSGSTVATNVPPSQNSLTTPHPPPQHTWSHPSQPPSSWPPIDPSLIDKLDPIFVKLYNEEISKKPPPSTDIQTIRQNFTNLYRHAQKPPTGVGGIGESTVPGWQKYPDEIAVRVYVPPGEPAGVRLRWPVHFNFHSGAYAVGDLDTDAHLAHHICARAQCCVIDVAYRLVPDVPFGVGIMDAFEAVRHVLGMKDTYMIDADCITLGGSSSGGSIALIVNHLLRDAGYGDSVKGVIVGTPIISDVRKIVTPDQSPWASMSEFQNAPLLDWQKVKFFDTLKLMSLGQLSAKEQKQDLQWFPDAMNAPNFKNLAAVTFVGTAEVDPLRDEAEGYAEKVREGGNEVVVKRYPGMPHQFMYFDRILPQGQEYVEDVIGHVRQCLHPPGEHQEKAHLQHPDQAVQNRTAALPQQTPLQSRDTEQIPQNGSTAPQDTDADVSMANDVGA